MLTIEKKDQIKTTVNSMLQLDDQGRAIMMAVGSALLSRQMMSDEDTGKVVHARELEEARGRR